MTALVKGRGIAVRAVDGLVKGLAVAILGALLSLPVLAAQPPGATPANAPSPGARVPPAKLLLPDFSSLGSAATDSVAITLDASLLAFAARFLDTGDPDERSVKEMIGGLQGIYVRSYTFDKAFAYPASDIAAIRKQLGAPCWQQIVQTRSSKQQTAVDIFICQAQQKPLGLAVIATEPRQFTIVNIVGAIDLEKLHRLEGRLGVPKLPAEQ